MAFAGNETLLDMCKREIGELHAFFEAWLAGDVPATDPILSRFQSVLAPEFTLIGPDGEPRSRATVVDWIRDGHGRRPDLHIWIDNAELHWSDGSTAIASYEEWQREAGAVNARRSTSVFLMNSTMPNGLVWLHVHETWLDEPA